MPTGYRQVIEWVQFDGLSYKEIAARLDKTEGAVRTLYARALSKLIGGAAQTGNGKGLGAGGSLALERPSGRRPLMLRKKKGDVPARAARICGTCANVLIVR